MEVILDHKLKEYLLSQDKKKIVVNNFKTRMCCGNMYVPVAKLGEPDETRNYFLYKLEDGLQVYVQRGIEAKDDKLYLRLRDFLLFKDIEVEGNKMI
ncbi:MAG: CC/Se motif family (seleno)protein [Bacillota bacterium]